MKLNRCASGQCFKVLLGARFAFVVFRRTPTSCLKAYGQTSGIVNVFVSKQLIERDSSPVFIVVGAYCGIEGQRHVFFGLREGVMHDVDPCCWSLIQRPCRIEDGGRYQKVTRDGGGGWNQKKDYETGKAEDGGHVVVAAVLKLFLLVLTCTVAAVCHRL